MKKQIEEKIRELIDRTYDLRAEVMVAEEDLKKEFEDKFKIDFTIVLDYIDNAIEELANINDFYQEVRKGDAK